VAVVERMTSLVVLVAQVEEAMQEQLEQMVLTERQISEVEEEELVKILTQVVLAVQVE
jgi:hypothetical protein